MAQRAQAQGRPDAAERLVDVLLSVIGADDRQRLR